MEVGINFKVVIFSFSFLNQRTTTTRRSLHSVSTQCKKPSFRSTSTCLFLSLTFWKLRRSTTSTFSSFALFWNGRQHSSYLKSSGSTLWYIRLLFPRYDYRIKYLNLKKTRSLNALSLEDVDRLWIPFLVFDNTEKNEATKVEPTIFLIYAYTLSSGYRRHRVNIDEGGRLHCKHRRQCGGDQHLRGSVQQDHFRASLHEDIQVYLPASALPLWHTGISHGKGSMKVV